MIAKALKTDKTTIEIPFELKENNGVKTLFIPKDSVGDDIEYIDILPKTQTALEGDEGYAVISHNRIYYFKNDGDKQIICERNNMPIFGIKKENECYVAIVTSMSYSFHTYFEKKDDKYYLYPRFMLDGEPMDQDIRIEYHSLSGEDADYNGMAKTYRNYILENKICTPIKERMKNRPELEYAVYAPLVRIRQGWKPCPSPVLEQTPETEPPMHVACDFEQVGKIIDKFKEYGIKSAEISLVGWNMRGHDGRWPDALPVEPALGGEKKLREIIKKGQDNGYNMTCHTNSTDAYSISSLWNEEHIIRNKDMSLYKGFQWSGGQMYFICPKYGYENSKKVLPEVADLGFRGIHYIDVMSSIHPQKCYHKDHKLTKYEAIDYYRKIAELATELFGGFSSEGSADYACPFMDYVLYACNIKKDDSINCEVIPFWELVYHGIVLYNPFSDGMNYTIKEKDTQLTFIEYGGRPSFYFHSRFVDETSGVKNWMGVNDLKTDDEHLDYCVQKIKEGCDEYDKMSHLQLEFMEKYEKKDGVAVVTYSDGTVITVDHNKGEYTIQNS